MAIQNHGMSGVISLVATVVLAGMALPAQAQRQNPAPRRQEPTPTAQAGISSKKLQQFTSAFQAGVFRGCLANPPKNLRNPRGYCNCYANAFLNRYQPQDLITIEQRANTSEAASLIALMMSPEIRACKLQN